MVCQWWDARLETLYREPNIGLGRQDDLLLGPFNWSENTAPSRPFAPFPQENTWFSAQDKYFFLHNGDKGGGITPLSKEVTNNEIII